MQKKSSIAEHLIKNVDCVNNYDLSNFKALKNFTYSFELVRLNATSISLYKLELCMQKEYDYKVFVFI